MPLQTLSDLRARVIAAMEMEGAAAEELDAAATTPPPPTCPVCMEPWTCNGDHRICCIPCGHVYGRSCLERWLHHSADDSAKCPQCGEQFEDKLITNLYAPGNLWDGCCRLQELKSRCKSVIKEMEGGMLSMVTEHTSKCDSRLDRLRAELKEEIAEMREEMKEEIAKSHADIKESFRADWERALDQIHKSWNEKMATADADMALMKDQIKKMQEENATATDLLDQMSKSWNEKMAAANANMTLMKDQIKKMQEENVTAMDLLDQMKKMAEEENATPTDLLEFMEHSLHPAGHQTYQNGCISTGISKRRLFCPIIIWGFLGFSLVAFFQVCLMLKLMKRM